MQEGRRRHFIVGKVEARFALRYWSGMRAEGRAPICASDALGRRWRFAAWRRERLTRDVERARSSRLLHKPDEEDRRCSRAGKKPAGHFTAPGRAPDRAGWRIVFRRRRSGSNDGIAGPGAGLPEQAQAS